MSQNWETRNNNRLVYNLLKLNQEYQNRSVTIKDIKTVIIPKIESPGSDGYSSEFFKTFKDLFQIFLENRRNGNLPKKLLQGKHCLDTKIRDMTKKENHRPISLMNIHAKILQKILVKWIKLYIYKILHYVQQNSYWHERMVYICKSITVVQHINARTNENI